MNNEKGFTLVEVVVALVVVTIVMTPLLQMFVTSSYANRDAQLMDVANIVAVRQAETFKADPDPGQDQANYFSTKYYDSTGNVTGTAIEVVSTLNSSSASPTTSSAVAYYPDFVGHLDSQLAISLDPINVIITNTSNTPTIYNVDCIQGVTSIYSTSVQTVINNTLPIEVDYPPIPPPGTSSLTITLTNNSNAEAEFYIFNASGPPFVNFAPESLGSYSVSYVPDKTSSSDTSSMDMEYDLVLTVYNRLNKDVNGNIVPAEILKYSAKQYVHPN